MHMLVENATSPWGQSWERVFHKHSCIQFIALVPTQDCPHGEIRHLTISLYVNILLLSSHSSILKVFFRFKKNLSNTYIFEYRSTFYHNTVRVLPLGAQVLGTQSSWVPKGNTQKNPKFWPLWVPNPKIPMEFRHKPNPTHTQNLVRVRVLPLGTRTLGTQSSP
jgi:hypothetical protein